MQLQRTGEHALTPADVEVEANFVTVARSIVRQVRVANVEQAVKYGRLYEHLLALDPDAETVELEEEEYELLMAELEIQGTRFGITYQRVCDAFEPVEES